MGLNKVDDYFRKDTELQNYTKTGVILYPYEHNHQPYSIPFNLNTSI